MNKKVISIITTAVVITALFAGCKKEDNAATDSDTLIVGTEAGFAPYEFMEGDKVVGIDMDIAQAIAASMGKNLEIKNMDFEGALLAVQQGKVDFVAAGVSVDADRDKVMDFSDDYVNSTEVVVVNASSSTIATNDDLAGKIIGVQQGNIADFWVENNANAQEIKRYTQFSQAAEDLKNNKIDCIVMDQYPAEDLVTSNPELKILDADPLFQDKYAIAVNEGNKELLDKINAVIKDLKDSGKLDEIVAKYAGK